MDVAARAVITWMATWAALIVAALLLPLVLPDRWQDHDHLRAAAFLWWLSVLAGPVVACAANRRWIRTGVRKAGTGGGRA